MVICEFWQFTPGAVFKYERKANFNSCAVVVSIFQLVKLKTGGNGKRGRWRAADRHIDGEKDSKENLRGKIARVAKR